MNESQKALRDLIFDVIENQIRDNDPPDTRVTLNRLIDEGFSQEEAMVLIGRVLAFQVYEILNNGTAFDRKRYARELAALPEMNAQELAQDQ